MAITAEFARFRKQKHVTYIYQPSAFCRPSGGVAVSTESEGLGRDALIRELGHSWMSGFDLKQAGWKGQVWASRGACLIICERVQFWNRTAVEEEH